MCLRNLFYWVVTTFTSMVFVFAGTSKLLSAKHQVDSFADWNYSPTLMYTVGLLELLGGLALAFPKLRPVGVFVLYLMSGAAFGTHLSANEWGMSLFALFMSACVYITDCDRD